MHALLDRGHIDDAPDTFLRVIGNVFAVFDQQDSGNVSYGVEIAGARWFVKTAGDPADRRPFLDHAARVGLLRNAARLAASCAHRALSPLRDRRVSSRTTPDLRLVPRRAHRRAS